MFFNGMKRGVLITLIIAMLFSLPVMAESVDTQVYSDAFQLKVNGCYIDADVYYTESGVYLPLRAVAENMGYEVIYNGDDRSVNIITENPKNTEIAEIPYRIPEKADSSVLPLHPNSLKIYVNGIEAVNSFHLLHEGTTYVIMSGLYRDLNAQVVYDENSMTIRVYSPEYVTFKENEAVFFNDKMLTEEQFADLGKFVYNGVPESGKNTGYADLTEYLLTNAAYTSVGEKIVSMDNFDAFCEANKASLDQMNITDKEFFTNTVLKDFYYRNSLTLQLLSNYYKPTLDELEALLEKSPYGTGHYMKAKHILIMKTEDDTGLRQAEEILEQLQKNPEKFDELMNSYSQDPGSKTNPEGYLFTEGDMVTEFYEGTLPLEENEISGIVESQYGYHIILKVKDYPSGVPFLAEAEVTQTLTEQYINDLLYQMLITEIARSDVFVNNAYSK